MAGELGPARWWEIRRAHNLKPVSYRCPLCSDRLPALSEHMLMFPEGRSQGRRHAHSDCVLAARRAGRLPTRAEWRAAQPPGERAGPAALARRLWTRLSGRSH